MVLRTTLSRGVALPGPGLHSVIQSTTQFRRTAMSRPTRQAGARIIQNTSLHASYSTESAVPVIRGNNIDVKTGRPRTRTTSSSSSSSNKAKAWPRYPKFLKDSPSKTLSLRVKSRAKQNEPLDFETWQLFDNAASSKSLRLPIVTLQHMIREDESQQRTSLSDGLCSLEEARRRASSLAYKGITQEDVRTWSWILAEDNPDARAARFLLTDAAGNSRPKPIFMLLQMLQRENAFIQGKTLAKLHQYIDEHHVKARLATPQLPFGAVRRSLDSGLNMAPQTFVLTMRMLVYHYLRIWPSALTAVATLMSDYIKTIPHMAQVAAKKRAAAENGTEAATTTITNNSTEHGEESEQDREVFADMCYVFNSGLELLRQKAPVDPVFNMRYNWRAQRVLLYTSTSAEIPRPLLISRNGFRSIRSVLLGLGKSPDERRVSMRMARSWPPYRRDWDGLDEQRRPKDDFSRSVQAGVMMHEAGYGDKDHERALNVLGGVQPGESPTVQTRTLSPRIWTGKTASLNAFSEWAARVRATRDVNEAWREFNSNSATGEAETEIKPSLQVYTEMYLKLFAAPVERHHPAESESSTATWPHGKELLPGDAREVYPVHDATLTPFERARISPPTVGQLYNQMMAEGTRPVGQCLAVLISNATNLSDVMRYLYDSGMDERTIGALRLPDQFTASPLSRSSPVIPTAESNKAKGSKQKQNLWKADRKPSLSVPEDVRHIPLPVFNAYIKVLCRLQPVVSHIPASPKKQLRTQMVHHAIRLTMMRLPPSYDSGRSYLAPYYTILKKLSYPRVLVGPEHTTDGALHNQESLALVLEVYAHLLKIGSGIDDAIFRAILRAALVYTNDQGNLVLINTEHAHGGKSELMQQAHATIVQVFNDLISDGPGGVPDAAHPATRHNIKAFSLDLYLQFLAYVGDAESMAAALLWVASVFEDPVLLEDAKSMDNSQHSALQRSLILYRIVAEASSDPRDAARMAEVEAQFKWLRTRGSTWHWPTSGDADQYVLWKQGDSQQREFWMRIRPVGR